MNINSPILTKKSWGTSAVLGIVSMFSVAAIGFAGTTHAVSGGGEPTAGAAPAAKADCKHDGWMQYEGFKNQGSCVAWVNAHGYGGNEGQAETTANANAWWNFDISGDDNVVNLVINYIFG